MSRFRPETSILAGRSTLKLQADLDAAQDAYLELSKGKRVVSASYSQGDGSKSVTYTQADLGNLVMLIKELQAQLGIDCQPRKALRPVF